MEKNLTIEQLKEIGGRIIDMFYRDCDGGCQYGCDWPTMRVLYPRRCRVFDRLRAAYKAKVAA